MRTGVCFKGYLSSHILHWEVFPKEESGRALKPQAVCEVVLVSHLGPHMVFQQVESCLCSMPQGCSAIMVQWTLSPVLGLAAMAGAAS